MEEYKCKTGVRGHGKSIGRVDADVSSCGVQEKTMLRRLRIQCWHLLPISIMRLLITARCAFPQTFRIGTVVDNFLIPISQPSGFCSDGESFWNSNYSAVTGGQEIYRLKIWTHQITDSIRALDSTPSGLAWGGMGIRGISTYPYNPHCSPDKISLVRLSGSGSILGYVPAEYTCYWAGITWDGRDLYYGTNVCFASPKGEKSMIYKVNQATGAVIDSIPPPSGNMNGLVYNKGDLWYCDDNNGYIFEIDTTGEIIREFPLDIQFHGPSSGLTIAKHYLWAVDMAGVGGPRIYEIDIGEAPAIPEDLAAFDGENIPLKTRPTWQPSASPDIEWHKIYRGPMSPYGSGILTEAVVIDSVPGNVTTFTDTTATVGLAFAYWVSAVDSNGVESFVSNETDGYVWSPYSFKLGQNYSNPFNGNTTIPYEVPAGLYSSTTPVEIAAHDVLGRKVTTLLDEIVGPADRTVTFDGSGLPSGVYFCRMQSGSFSKTIALVLIR